MKILESMAPEDDCQHEMLVETTWKGRKLAIPLAQVQLLDELYGKNEGSRLRIGIIGPHGDTNSYKLIQTPDRFIG